MEEVVINEASQAQGVENLRVTEEMREHLLKGTKWMKFFFWLGVIGMVFIVLVGLGSLVGGLCGSFIADDEFGIFGGTGIVIGILYLVFAAVYIYPMKKSFQLISEIRTAMDGSQTSYESAAEIFAKLLNYTGICTIIGIVCYVIFIFVMLGVAFSQGLGAM